MNPTAMMQVNLRLPTRLLFSGEAQKFLLKRKMAVLPCCPITLILSPFTAFVLLVTDKKAKSFFGIDQGLLVKHGYH